MLRYDTLFVGLFCQKRVLVVAVPSDMIASQNFAKVFKTTRFFFVFAIASYCSCGIVCCCLLSGWCRFMVHQFSYMHADEGIFPKG